MKRQFLSGLTVSLMLVAAAYCAPNRVQKGQALNEGQITIRVLDYSQSNPSVRQHAEQVAGDILQKAGVVARWIDCPVGSSGQGACSSPASTLDFFVNLLPRSMSDRLHQPVGVLGSAVEGSSSNFGFIASVFYDVARQSAAEGDVDFGELLGDAIAHELGHLLLGTKSHSARGLMCAFWSGNQLRFAAKGWLEFSESDAKRIHTAMNARTLAATASADATELARATSSDEQVSTRADHR